MQPFFRLSRRFILIFAIFVQLFEITPQRSHSLFAGDSSVAAYRTKSLSLFSDIIAQAIVDPAILDGNIEEVCEKLNQLT